MKVVYLSILFFTLIQTSIWGQNERIIGQTGNDIGPFEISGRILDRETREAIIGANVLITATGDGESSDVDGRFNIRLMRGIYELKVSYIGYVEQTVRIEVRGKGNLNINLQQDLNQLDEVLILGTNPDGNVRDVTSGVEKLSVESIASIPQFAGEVDILKTLTLLPGVNSSGEAASGFNVRGGGYDQNLILLGGAPIYNPSHMFGFFSAFNADMINNVVLYKGGIPANFGGRASSILDLSTKKGDMQKWSSSTTFGTISTKTAIQGPIVKDKVSMLATGRISYVNYLLNRIQNADYKNSAANFYDGSLVLNYNINDNTSIEYNGYYSSDGFNLASDTIFSWNNFINVLSLNHAFNEKFFLKTSLTSSEYKFDIFNTNEFSKFNLISKIQDQGINLDFKYIPSEKNEFIVGGQSKFIRIDPGELIPGSEFSSVNSILIPREQALESAVFFQHNFNITDRIGLSYGLRYVDYRFLGPGISYEYDGQFPKSTETILSGTEFGENELISPYRVFEPRLSLRVGLLENLSLKFGYNQMNQFIHLMSNTATIAPTDVWKLSDEHIEPQASTQYSAGIFANFLQNTIETSIEGYYKSLSNVLEYKDGALLLLNPYLESDLLSGIGEAYGIEFFLKKKSKPLTGWFSYTYSRSLRQVIGAYPSETINQGQVYSSNFDKPHNLTVVFEYKFNNLLKYSSVFNYSSGRPVTYPLAKFRYNSQEVAFFNTRNENRIPDYYRLDMSLTFNFNTDYRWLNGDWVISVYNILGRRNAFSVYFDDLPKSAPQAYQLSLLGVPVPSISYSLKI